jgi:hypothetical protein
MELRIYDVEHGACVLLRSDNGTRMIIDWGHSASTSYLLRQRSGTAAFELGQRSSWPQADRAKTNTKQPINVRSQHGPAGAQRRHGNG